MAKLSTPRLADVPATRDGLATIADRMIEPGIDTATRFRITISDAGTIQAVVNLTGNGAEWETCSASVQRGASTATVQRLNRLLDGFADAGLHQGNGTPTVETYWRAKKAGSESLGVRIAGDFTPVPLVLRLDPVRPGHAVAIWFAEHHNSLQLDPNSQHGYRPIPASKPISAPRQRKASTVRAKVGAGQPAVTPMATPVVAPSAPKAGPAAIPVAPAVTQSLPAGHPGLFKDLPRANGRIVHVDPGTADEIAAAVRGFKQGHRMILLLTGPTGTGKTLLAKHIAAQHGLPYFRADVMGMVDFASWTGAMDLVEKNGHVVTQFTYSRFLDAIRSDGPYGDIPRLVHLDEITRTTPDAANAALPIMDGSDSIFVPSLGASVPISSAVLFVLTANEGAEYGGAQAMDAALENRIVGTIDIGQPSAALETTILVEQGGIPQALATRFVQVAAQVRAMHSRGEVEKSVSTRQLVEAAIWHGQRGLDPVRSAMMAFGRRFSTEGDADSDRFRVETLINNVLR
jgi:CbbQ/NirQ/NorQ C-terminal/AAA domain (dynein-related subfamily)